ncbi:hypothetical protein JTB14_012627 [Gonioctena quinquepunctata]|nr:hypothetical protein JTB14_012627 [Gonioctena quinquepunctata]
MVVSPAKRTLGKVAALLGMVQGLAWSGMSLTCIVLFNRSHTMDQPESFRQLVEYLLNYWYLDDSNTASGFIVRPHDFTILMWIYFFLSTGWFAGSIDQFYACHYNKMRQSTMMIIWGALTLSISVVDLVFSCLLFRDYAYCGDAFHPYTEATNCYLAVGIVMTLAARGFTLWVVNVVFSLVMIANAVQIKKDDSLRGGDYNYKIPRVKPPQASPSPFESVESNSSKNGVFGMDPSRAPKNKPPFINPRNKFVY